MKLQPRQVLFWSVVAVALVAGWRWWAARPVSQANDGIPTESSLSETSRLSVHASGVGSSHDTTTSVTGRVASLLAGTPDGASPMSQAAALARLVNEVAVRDIPAALTAITGSSRTHNELRQMLIHRWAAADAPVAADWVERNLSGGSRSAALEAVASTWADSDAAGAQQWAARLGDADERSSALLAVAGEMAAKDPVAALALAVELPAGERRDEFLTQAASEWAGRDSKSAVEWGKQIEDAELRAQMLGAIATGFADKEPAAAATLAAQSLPPGRAQDDAVVSIVQRWVQDNANDAATWVTTFPTGPLRDTALEALVQLWADKDVTEAGIWINSLKDPAGSDIAIAAYVDKVGVQFPEMAAEWAQEIRNAGLRDERMSRLAELWLRQDDAAARKWISESPLPEAEKTRLLAAPKP